MADRRAAVVILGGGPAGASAAIAVRQRSDARVVVIEAGDYSAECIGESVPPDVMLLLQRLGVAQRFVDDAHDPCHGFVSVWGDERAGRNDFIYNPLGHAWHLDRRRFDRMLASRARELGAEFHLRAQFLGAERHDDGFALSVRLADRSVTRIPAATVVDATGPAARFARSLKVMPVVSDRFFAIARIATLRRGALPGLTLLEATRDGWWYAAPLPGRRVVTMMAMDDEMVATLSAHACASWRSALEATTLIGPALARCELEDETFLVKPVVSSTLERTEGDGWYAAGDAASSFDPLAAQGIYKALEDGIDVGERIASGEAAPRDAIARRYADYRANRAWLYAREQRWRDAPFWKRRSEPPSAIDMIRMLDRKERCAP
jgi:flavin-dependent dehydrogenase